VSNHESRTPGASTSSTNATDTGSPPPVVTSSKLKTSPWLEPTLANLDSLDVDSVAVGWFSTSKPLPGLLGLIDWRLCGRVSALVIAGTITGAAGEKILMPTHGRLRAKRLFVFGWGPADDVTEPAKHLRWMADVLVQAGVERVALALPEPAAGLLDLAEAHLKKPLGTRAIAVFAPDAG
jgi:hypothetical protein